jgi:hypothetical protein
MGMGLAQLDIPHGVKALATKFALQWWEGLRQDLIPSAWEFARFMRARQMTMMARTTATLPTSKTGTMTSRTLTLGFEEGRKTIGMSKRSPIPISCQSMGKK